MRREAKLGIFITLSAGLVVAVLTGRAITNGGPAKEGRVALSSGSSTDKDAADILEALQQDSTTSSQAPRPQDAVDALVAELPPAKHDLSAPVSANDEMKRYLEGGKDSSASSDVADILDILDKTSVAAPAAQSASHTTAADISVSSESSQPAQSGKPATLTTPKTVPPAVSSTAISSMPSSDLNTLDRLEKAALASEPAVKASVPADAPKKDAAMDYLTRIENKTLGVQAEGTTTYKVQSGDSFWSIADKFYGNGARHNDIARANPSLKSSNLSVGTVLTIPLDKPKTPADAPALSTLSSSEPSSQKTCKVESGDSLWSIAAKVYGNGVQWEKIARANPSVNPDNLKVGSTLVIP